MRRVLIAIAALIFSSFAFAQVTTPAPTNPNILQAIQQLQNSVNQLQGNDTQEAAVLQSIQKSQADIEKAIQGLTPTASNVWPRA